MSEWTLYSKSGVAKVVVKELDYRGEFMGDSRVTFDLDSPVPVEFAFGDYLTYRGEVYTLRELPSVEKQARRSSYGGAFRYENITLQGMEWEPTYVEFTDYVPSDNNEHYTGLSTFSFYCDHPSKLLERIQACMDVAYTDGVAWTFTLSPNVDLTNFHAETIDITSGTSCWAALALMYSKWKIPYKRVGRTVTVGATAQVTAYTYEYGKDNGLLKLKRVIDTDKTIVTRLRVYGSDKNMPYRYYNNKGFINESMYMPYLMLPAVREHQAGDGHDVYLLSDNVTDYGIIDAEIHFDGSGDNEEIYPTLEGMTAEDAGVTTVTYQNDGNLDEIVSCVNPQDNGVVADGNYDADHPVDTDGVEVVKTFEVIVPYLGFDWHDKLTSEATATIIMKSGKCSAREFEVLRYDPVSESDVTQGVRLTLNRAQDEVTSYVYPNNTWTVDGGDKYVITGIEMPDTYVIAAENRLEAAAEAWLADNDHPNYRYEPSLDNIYLKKNPDDAAELIIGNKLAWVDTDLGFDGGLISGDVTIRTLSISEGKSALPEYEITLNDTVSSGTIEQLTAQVDAIMSGFAGGGGISLEQVLTQIRNVGGKMFLSKIANDAAQGVISFVKGVLFGNGDTGINENGEAKLSSVQTPSYSGTDIVSDKGFKVWEDNEGKSHMMVDYFSARIKAFFASLEIRKIEHSAGNRIESPAGNTLALVKKYGIDSHGDPYEIVDKWYARRYTFAGVSFGMPKLVYQVANYFGVWKEDPSATVAYYRCYWTAEDKEDKKAVVNNWKVGDQAFCQTFNLRVPQGSGYASNKRYWRLVTGTGYETIEGTEYAYIDLTNIEDNVTVVDEQSQTYVCKHGYESGSDKPEAGDDVACFGNQIKPQERGGAIQYVTYDPNASQSGDGVPCVKMFSGIGGNADHPFDLSRYVIQKQSPTGVAIRADQFTIYSASGTGMSSTDPSSTLICDRGNYSSDADYAYGDLVQYRGSSWLCIASSKITNIEPSDANSSYWKIYARRGMGTPYIQLDYSNVIVSTNSEGRISSQSDIIVRPTRIEIYVDGNRVPVSAWSLSNSYVFYYNRTQYFTQSGLQPGINIGSFTASSDYVTINWQYYPIVNGQTIINPIIDSTSIAFHVVFTYKGETCEADTSIPLTVQRPGANGTNGTNGTNGHDVMAEYSVNGSSWHSTFQTGDIYVHYSYDGGSTWTTAIRFVGKSIEFEKGIRHFDQYGDLEDYLLGKEGYYTDADFGYYLTDEDDGGVVEATIWYFYSENQSFQDNLEYVPFPQSGDVNYFTSYDGHLWSADTTSEYWVDMGVIQGADGADGISITLDPATVIFEQDEDDISKFIGVNKAPYFYSTVRVWQGATPLSGTFISSQDISATNCTAQLHPSIANAIVITEIGTYTDNDGNTHYYQSGKVEVTVHVGNQSTTLTLNWAANLLGTWKLSVKNDTMEAVSSMTVAVYDEDGQLTTSQLSSAITQNSLGVSLSAKKDDVETAGLHLDGQNSSINLVAGKVNFIDPNGGSNTKISIDTETGTLHATDGVFEGKITARNYLVEYADLITFCYDKDGMTGLFIPGDENYQTMYDGGDYSTANSIDISNSWYFMVTETEVRLPNYINLVGQQVTIYNPTIGGSAAAKKTVIRAGDTLGGGDIIRGVGLSWDTKNFEPVPIESYRPVREIEFCDGLIQLQCVPSTTPNHYEWCVVNIGTNVVKIRENFE